MQPAQRQAEVVHRRPDHPVLRSAFAVLAVGTGVNGGRANLDKEMDKEGGQAGRAEASGPGGRPNGRPRLYIPIEAPVAIALGLTGDANAPPPGSERVCAAYLCMSSMRQACT